MPVRSRRKNFWEPFFDPSLNDKFKNDDFKDHDWDFQHDNGPKYRTFSSAGLPAFPTFKITNVNFQYCDFFGSITEKVIVFKDCIFIGCDFGLSTFKNAKFTKCTFELTSFTQSTIERSEFRDCKFKKIGISGNETNFDNTVITNPDEFINAAYTNTSHLPAGSSPLEQKMRLEETKSTFSRRILSNLLREGSEYAFYKAVRTSTIQECTAKMARAVLSLRHRIRNFHFLQIFGGLRDIISLVGGAVDFLLLRALGELNAWGASLARPTLAGVVLIIGFAIAYMNIDHSDFYAALKKSIEVTFLFGYTNHSHAKLTDAVNLLTLFNALVGVAWYVVTMPTIVNKLTRVRS